MEIIERIYQLLDEKEKRAYALCELLGIRTSTMSTWRSRQTDPPARMLKTIANFLGVSLDYLLTGEEAAAPRYTSTQEDELLDLFRALPEFKKYEFIGEIKGYLKAYEDSQKYVDQGKRLSV